jgi:hypothetical protein
MSSFEEFMRKLSIRFSLKVILLLLIKAKFLIDLIFGIHAYKRANIQNNFEDIEIKVNFCKQYMCEK